MKLLFIGLAILATAFAQAPSAEYLPPAADYGGAASNFVETNFLEPEPAHSLADDGYRYRTVRRFRHRQRRDVSELSNEYLPPVASAPQPSYAAPAPVAFASAPAPVFSAPAPAYAAPAPGFDAGFEVAASEPAHTLAADGYRYKTQRRVRYRQRRRRDVSELSNEYLPPAASAPEVSYIAPAPAAYASAPAPVFSAPAPAYSAPAPAYESSYEVAASEPAHTLAADGYRYKTQRRVRYRQRRRRDVSELSNEYLPPVATAPAPSYIAPAPAAYASAPAPVFSAPAPSYAAPAPGFDAGFEVAASEPAHTLAADGYRYKTQRRVRYRQRRRRDVSELSNEYLPPAASAPEVSYIAPAPAAYASAPAPVFSAPAPAYSAPAPAYESSYEVAASEPAHTLAADGYRYKTQRRVRYRHRRRRDVSELSNEYLPPVASAPAPSYAAPAAFASAPAPVFSAPAPAYEASYEVAASEPAHTLAADGYRYKTVKRYRYRHRH